MFMNLHSTNKPKKSRLIKRNTGNRTQYTYRSPEQGENSSLIVFRLEGSKGPSICSKGTSRTRSSPRGSAAPSQSACLSGSRTGTRGSCVEPAWRTPRGGTGAATAGAATGTAAAAAAVAGATAGATNPPAGATTAAAGAKAGAGATGAGAGASAGTAAAAAATGAAAGGPHGGAPPAPPRRRIT